MQATRKIITGIFGGSFNPIHAGHVSLARQIRRIARLDEIWLVVSPQNPLKRQSELADDRLRVEMTRLALADEPFLEASDYELHLPKPSYTFDTLQAMKRDFPDRSFTLIIGADNWACFDKWRKHKEIMENHDIVIYPRDGYPIDKETLPHNVTLADTELLNVSSTEIRERISRGLDYTHLVAPSVKAFIERHGLYK